MSKTLTKAHKSPLFLTIRLKVNRGTIMEAFINRNNMKLFIWLSYKQRPVPVNINLPEKNSLKTIARPM